jgi:octaprenyl-diphosphate synthase
VIEKVKSLGGIEYTTKKMLEYQQKANDLLKVYPESDYKTALITMVNYVIERKI